MIVGASIVPGILWVWYFRSIDRINKEPIPLLVAVFIVGGVMVIPAAIFEAPFRNFLTEDASILTQALVSFFVIGLSEEFFKFLGIYFISYRNREFDEVVDGIIYGATAGIGFSVVENILYALSYGISVTPIRAIVASLAHASFSGFLGLYLGRAKFSNHPRLHIVTGLIVAVTLHGFYDFILISQLFSPILAIGLITVIYYLLRMQIEKVQNRLS